MKMAARGRKGRKDCLSANFPNQRGFKSGNAESKLVSAFCFPAFMRRSIVICPSGTSLDMDFEMHNDAGHLTALGWTMFGFYLVAALLSFRAAASARSQSSAVRNQQSVVNGQWSSSSGRVWLWLGVVLAVLGLNKPLDLQTWIIQLGRRIAGAEHLTAYRTELYVLFFLGFMLAIIALFAVVARRLREPIGRFVRQFPLAAVGCVLVCAYIVIRAADIDRVDLMLGFDLERIPFLWLLEAGGLLLVIVQALRAAK
jgi:hypothetical protein